MKLTIDVTVPEGTDPIEVADVLLDVLGNTLGLEPIISVDGVEPTREATEAYYGQQREPDCHLVEGRFQSDTATGVRVDCVKVGHEDRECPGEGVMFSDQRSLPGPSDNAAGRPDHDG